MRFIQRYKSPKFIGVCDDVRYKGKDYQRIFLNVAECPFQIIVVENSEEHCLPCIK